MHVTAMEMIFIICGVFILGLVILIFTKSGVWTNLANGTYYQDFVQALQNNNQTF